MVGVIKAALTERGVPTGGRGIDTPVSRTTALCRVRGGGLVATMRLTGITEVSCRLAAFPAAAGRGRRAVLSGNLTQTIGGQGDMVV